MIEYVEHIDYEEDFVREVKINKLQSCVPSEMKVLPQAFSRIEPFFLDVRGN